MKKQSQAGHAKEVSERTLAHACSIFTSGRNISGWCRSNAAAVVHTHLSLTCVSAPCSYFAFRISGFHADVFLATVCAQRKLPNKLIYWATRALRKPKPHVSFFQPFVPLIGKCTRLRGQEIHCSEGATSETDSFDLGMVLVSSKLTSNRGRLVWFGDHLCRDH